MNEKEMLIELIKHNGNCDKVEIDHLHSCYQCPVQKYTGLEIGGCIQEVVYETAVRLYIKKYPKIDIIEYLI